MFRKCIRPALYFNRGCALFTQRKPTVAYSHQFFSTQNGKAPEEALETNAPANEQPLEQVEEDQPADTPSASTE